MSSGPNGMSMIRMEHSLRLNKPILILDMQTDLSEQDLFSNWIDQNGIQILNVAGPRETAPSGVYSRAYQILTALISDVFIPLSQ